MLALPGFAARASYRHAVRNSPVFAKDGIIGWIYISYLPPIY